MKLHHILVIFLVSASANCDAVKKGYILTAPVVFDANSSETICIAFQGISSNGTVNVELKTLETILSKTQQDILNGESKCFQLKVPIGNFQNVVLAVNGSFENSDYTFSGSKPVEIKQVKDATFIQTDKAVYKPGQKVQFRILRLTSKYLSSATKIKTVWIENPFQLRLFQWVSPQSRSGLIDLNFQLSEEPQLGEWHIFAEYETGDKVNQKFKVEEYVLPKFSVQITPPAVILSNFKLFTWKVCAYYTYGEPVVGKIKANITGFPNSNQIQVEDEFRECRTMNVSVEQLNLNNGRIPRNVIVKFYAEITEYGTGVTMHDFKQVPVKTNPLILSLDAKQYYKPTLNYSGIVKVKNNDGSPAASVRLNVNFHSEGRTYETPKISKQYTTNEEGIVDFAIHFPKESNDYYTANIVAVDYYVSDSLTMHPTLSKTVKRWWSPTQSYIQIEKHREPLQCVRMFSAFVNFRPLTSDVDGTLVIYYLLISRNDITQNKLKFEVSNGLLRDTSTTSFSIPIVINPDMSPKFHLIVYYIREDGEIVSDSETFDVEKCFSNEVRMSFNEEKILPGSPASIHLSADANSLCALSVSDTSVDLLITRDFSEEKVFHTVINNLPSMKVPETPCHHHQRTSGGFYFKNSNVMNSRKAFDTLGVVTLTDLSLDDSSCKFVKFPTCLHKIDRVRHWGMHRYYDEMLIPGPVGASLSNRRMGASGGIPFKLASSTRGGSSRPIVRQYSESVPQDISGVRHVDQLEVEETSLPAVELRDHFPETWIWDIVDLGVDGQQSVEHNIPHSITKWTGDAFCMSPLNGLGMSSKASIKSFQPFFLTYTMPYSVKRGESFPLTVSIFNYLSRCFPVVIILEESNAYIMDGNTSSITLCLCGSKSYSHKYYIKPLETGNINITVRAHSTKLEKVTVCDNQEATQNVVAFDAMTKSLLVKSHGFPIEITESNWICVKDNSTTFEHTLELSDDVIKGSERAHVSVTGDLMGPTISGLDHLVRLPTGCGEQNMVLFVPNIYVLHYLNASRQLTSDVKSKAISNMEKGYQRELNYKRKDGSYSAFGNSDMEGSIWLTAFVVKSFAQAKAFIYVNSEELNEGIQYILRNQLKNGCFKSTGRLLHKDMQGGVAKSSASSQTLTLYIIIALLETGYDPSSDVIKRAFNCMDEHFHPNTYHLAMQAYAASLANKTKLAQQLINTLKQKSVKKGNMMYWSNSEVNSRAVDIETTSYVLLTLVKLNTEDNLKLALKVVRWLTQQRNAYGGFVSTQDTVLALESIADYLSLIPHGSSNVTIDLEANDLIHSFNINDENRLLLQSVPIPYLPNVLDIHVSGRGCALIQVSAKYNVLGNQSSSVFNLDIYDVSNNSTKNSTKNKILEICTNYQGSDENSNMVVVEIQMITGYETEGSHLEKLKNPITQLKRWEIEKDGTVQLYFDELTGLNKCFHVLVNEIIEVKDRKPATVKVYDYYQPEKSVSKEYSFLELPAPS